MNVEELTVPEFLTFPFSLDEFTSQCSVVGRTFEGESKPFGNPDGFFTIQPLVMHSSKTSVALANPGDDLCHALKQNASGISMSYSTTFDAYRAAFRVR